MSTSPPATDVRNLAAQYALGVAEPAEAAQFESLLLANQPIAVEELRAFEETAARLIFGQPVAEPAPSVRDRLLKGIRKPKQRLLPGFREEVPGFHVLRAGEGPWKPTAYPGIEMKLLAHDPTRGVITSLVKLAPGAVLPRHHHSVEEQCWVMEGTVRQSDNSLGMKAGDFFSAVAGTDHDALTTDTGCLLMIIGSAKDERID